MANDRFLIDYLPPYMQEYLEIKAIMEAEQPEISALWFETEQVFANQYILDATEYGVMRWESMLKIFPKATETLDERKFRILARLNAELPYTLTRLKEMLTVLCGEDGFVIDLQANRYHIDIKLAVGNHNNYGEVERLLTKMIPANLTQVINLMYNTHSTLSRFPHHAGGELPYASVYGATSQMHTTGLQLLHNNMNPSKRDGVTLSKNGEWFSVIGTPVSGGAAGAFYLREDVILEAGTYTLSVDSPLPFTLRFSKTTALVLSKGKTSVTSTITSPYDLDHIAITYAAGVEYNATFRLMLSRTAEPVPYEPYASGKVTPTIDYPQALNSAGIDGEISVTAYDAESNFTEAISIPTPDGLYGIPVASNGNFTDENGQQWVCDEMDFAEGVFVQRVGRKVLNGTETWFKSAVNSAAQYYTPDLKDSVVNGQHTQLIGDRCRASVDNTTVGSAYFNNGRFYICAFEDGSSTIDDWIAFITENPITIFYELRTPVKTALTPDQSAALGDCISVHTLHPNATFTTDDGAKVSTKYVKVGGLSNYTHEQLRNEVIR